jgi:hypothetical protein
MGRHGGQLLARERAGDASDLGIDLLEAGAAIAAKDRAGQARRARLVGVGHGGMAVLDGFDRARPAVFDGVAHAAQETDAGIARVGEDHLPGEPHADHLIVDHVRRHADQRQVPAALPDRLMRRGMGDEMGEALEGDDVPVAEVLGDGLPEALEFGHDLLSDRAQISKKTVSFSPWRRMSKV